MKHLLLITKAHTGISLAQATLLETLHTFSSTWQLSDLFYNTLGGVIGGLIYYVGYKVKHKID